MKFSRDKIFHRSEINPKTYDAFFQYHQKYNSIASLKENSKQNYILNPDEEFYLIQNKNNANNQMKSVSFKPNKTICQKNGVLTGPNLTNIMNQYINYSLHKKKENKKNKKQKGRK